MHTRGVEPVHRDHLSMHTVWMVWSLYECDLMSQSIHMIVGTQQISSELVSPTYIRTCKLSPLWAVWCVVIFHSVPIVGHLSTRNKTCMCGCSPVIGVAYHIAWCIASVFPPRFQVQRLHHGSLDNSYGYIYIYFVLAVIGCTLYKHSDTVMSVSVSSRLSWGQKCFTEE